MPTLAEYIREHRLPVASYDISANSLNMLGCVMVGRYVTVHLCNGASFRVTLADAVDILQCEMRTDPSVGWHWGVVPLRRQSSALSFRIELVKHLGKVHGRNLRAFREDLTQWYTEFLLAGEWLPHVPTWRGA